MDLEKPTLPSLIPQISLVLQAQESMDKEMFLKVKPKEQKK